MITLLESKRLKLALRVKTQKQCADVFDPCARENHDIELHGTTCTNEIIVSGFQKYILSSLPAKLQLF